jgi:hypothetical protein
MSQAAAPVNSDFDDSGTETLIELRKAVLIGFNQISDGDYTVYTDETLPSLLMKIRDRGKRRLQQKYDG